MGYHHIALDELTTQPERPDIDPEPDPLAEVFSVTDGRDFQVLGIRSYTVEPGEQLPLAYHYHDEQEEALYVIDGVLHVETPDQEYVVEAGEIFAVEAGSAHRAYLPADVATSATVLGVGAPSDDTGKVYDPE